MKETTNIFKAELGSKILVEAYAHIRQFDKDITCINTMIEVAISITPSLDEAQALIVDWANEL